MSNDGNTENEQRKNRIKGIFDRAAPTYDHAGSNFFAHFGQGLVQFAEVKPKERVLDIASGRGASLFAAAQAVGEGGQVIGTDLSESMVYETSQEIRSLKMTNLSIVQMDAENLRFPDESFDTVLCGFALFFFPLLEQAMAEMKRVLVPGGCLAVTTWQKYEDERWKWFDKLVEEYLPPSDESHLSSDSQPPIPDLETAEGMQALMRTAGFINAQCEVEWYKVTYRDEEAWWDTQWSHGGRALLEEIESTCGVEGLERFRKQVFDGVRKLKQSDGIQTMWPALFTKAWKAGAK